ncbi:MAG TPA: hypothetical protein VMV72_05680 [Verrucomicrobiae bacterium]|nr:hypothetical protein [Verrucomicrobiae bacterium]
MTERRMKPLAGYAWCCGGGVSFRASGQVLQRSTSQPVAKANVIAASSKSGSDLERLMIGEATPAPAMPQAERRES